MSPIRQLRAALRQFADRPGLYGLLLLILALGIGVNAAMFGVGDAALFRDVPVRDPDALVRVFTREPESGEISNGSYPWFEGLRQQPVFTGVAAYSDWATLNVAAGATPTERVAGGLASGEFFQVLGVDAISGRVFGPDDDIAVGQHAVVVVSERYWRTRLSADPAAVGRTLRINRQEYAVLGVLPAGFDGPGLGSRIDLWLPLAMARQAMPGNFMPEDFRADEGFTWLDLVARLAPDTSRDAAQQALDAWSAHAESQRDPNAEEKGRGPYAKLMGLREAAVDPYGTEHQARNAWLLVAVAAMVLLIACANAAGLLAVRGEERAREIAVRMSLGASPRAVVAQLLTEATLLAAGAMLLGLGLAVLVVEAIAALAPPGVLLVRDPWDAIWHPRVLALSGACAALAVCAAALLPARRAVRLDLVEALRSGGGQATPAGGRQRTRAMLVGAQLALTAVLLVGAGLLLRTLWNNARVDPGFALSETLAAVVALAQDGLDPAAQRERFAEIERRVEALPGVRSAAWMQSAPVQSGGMNATAETDVAGTPKGVAANAPMQIVTPGVFETLGIALQRGRDFDPRDDGAAPVAIVNRAYAERMLPGVDPIGRRITSYAKEQGGATIVGLVADHRQRNLRDPDQAQVYLPLAQFPTQTMTLVVRAPGAIDDVLGALPRVVASIDPEIPVFRMRSLEQHVAQSYADARVFACLLAGFGVLAAALAAAGLFGILSYWVRGRTRELGIRMAIGASRGALARLVVGQCGLLIAVSLAAGLALSAPLGWALEGLLFGVGAHDPAVLAGALALLASVAALAAAVPMRRALRTDPTVALRYE